MLECFFDIGAKDVFCIILPQDWDFPYFVNNFDVKLPGLNTAHLKFKIPRCLRKEQWYVHITGQY